MTTTGKPFSVRMNSTVATVAALLAFVLFGVAVYVTVTSGLHEAARWFLFASMMGCTSASASHVAKNPPQS